MEPQGVLLYRERRRKSTMRRVQLEGGLGALGVLPYRERKRKSTLRRLQFEEGFGLGFLPAGRSERFWVFSEEKEHLEKSAS